MYTPAKEDNYISALDQIRTKTIYWGECEAAVERRCYPPAWWVRPSPRWRAGGCVSCAAIGQRGRAT
jgi:hypothetical protein